MSKNNNFYNLDPNLILATAEKNGYAVTGELIQLNSYENRVFEIKLEKPDESNKSEQNSSTHTDSLIAKFYRPGRWSRETILDEHRFLDQLRRESEKVPGTLRLGAEQSSVGEVDGIYFTFFEKMRGRMIQELNEPDFKRLGRWLARLHNIGSREQAEHRSYIGPSNDNKWAQLEKLLGLVSPEVSHRYEEAAVRIFENLDEQLQNFDFIRLHGDLHRGNILENSQSEFAIVDFDDMINGPEVQDFWMLMPNTNTDSPEFNLLIENYSELRRFPHEQLELIPLLRGYRIITYAMWIMNRWDDPSFPRLFPDFGNYSYWAEETESIEKISYQF